MRGEPCCGKPALRQWTLHYRNLLLQGKQRGRARWRLFPLPYSCGEQGFSQVISGCRCTTVTFTQTPGLLHPPLQGTPLSSLGPLNRGAGLLGFDCCFSYSLPASRFLAHSWEPVLCTLCALVRHQANIHQQNFTSPYYLSQ